MSALPAWFSIHPIDWKPAVGRLYDRPDGEHSRRERDMIRHIGIRPIIFSVNCYIAAVLALFISFSLDLKSPAWAMVTVYLTSQPLSGALRAKAVYRVVGTFVGGAVMVAIVPNLVNARSPLFFGWRSAFSFRCSTARRGPTCSYCPVILRL